MAFEQNLAQLEKLVAGMESGEQSLEELMANFERGKSLLAECRREIDAVRRRLEVVTAEGVKELDA